MKIGEIRKPVSLFWQTVFVFIPFLNLYAFSSVDKLKRGLCLWVGLGFVAGLIDFLIPIPFPWDYLISIPFLPILVYYMRKWSRQWNESISPIAKITEN